MATTPLTPRLTSQLMMAPLPGSISREPGAGSFPQLEATAPDFFAERHPRADVDLKLLCTRKDSKKLSDWGSAHALVGPVAVIIPTYNERENLEAIVKRVHVSVPYAHVLVVDDNSPDGTGVLADKLAERDPRIHVLHRGGKNGLGAAYIAGFNWALGKGYGAVVEMDADGSHQPEQLPALLDALAYADLVIGSRWVSGGRVVNWSQSRQLLSRGGNTYARLVLGIGLRDATAGYRVFRDTTLRRIALDEVESQGYCFQVDLALRALQAGLVVVEVPITFVERTRGASKMSRAIIIEALWRITRWGFSGRRKALGEPPVSPDAQLQPEP